LEVRLLKEERFENPDGRRLARNGAPRKNVC